MSGISTRIRIVGLSLAAALVATALIGGAASASSSHGTAAAAKAAARGHKHHKHHKSLAKQIKDKVKNGRYVGVNDLGDYDDHTYCSNGKWTEQDGSGHSHGKSWKITNAHRTKKGFYAKLKGSGGYEISVAKAKGHWKLGTWFNGPERQFKVERSKVSKKTCRKI